MYELNALRIDRVSVSIKAWRARPSTEHEITHILALDQKALHQLRKETPPLGEVPEQRRCLLALDEKERVDDEPTLRRRVLRVTGLAGRSSAEHPRERVEETRKSVVDCLGLFFPPLLHKREEEDKYSLESRKGEHSQ